MTIFQEWLKERRITQGLKQKELADELGFAEDTIYRWESGKSSPRLDQLQALFTLEGFQPTQDQMSDFMGIPKSEQEPRGKIYTAGNVSWVERQLDETLSEVKQRRVQRGISVFKEFFLQKRRVSSVNDVPGLYTAFIDALQCHALAITNVERSTDLETALRNISDDPERRFFPKLKLNEIIVAEVDKIEGSPIHVEFVAWLAAQAIFSERDPLYEIPQVIAVGRSYTIWRIAQLSTLGAAYRTTWLPLLAFRDEMKYRYSSNLIAYDLTTLHPGSDAKYLPYERNETPSSDRQEILDMLQREDKSRALILTVNGGLDRFQDPRGENEFRFLEDDYITPPFIRDIFKEAEKRGKAGQLAGEFLGWFLDHNGDLIDDDVIQEMSRSVCSQVDTWDNTKAILQRMTVHGMVWLVGSGAHKADAVYMMMKQGLANAFVIDKTIAMAIIDKLHSEGKPVDEYYSLQK